LLEHLKTVTSNQQKFNLLGGRKVKKLIKPLILFLIVIGAIFFNELLAQPGPPSGGGDPPCWPPSTCERPINGELIVLLIAGLAFGAYYIKNKRVLVT